MLWLRACCRAWRSVRILVFPILVFPILLLSAVRASYAVSCPVAAARGASAAEKAFLKSDYDQAAALYQAELAKQPHSPELIVGLSRVLLRQQKLTDADRLLQEALAQPNTGETQSTQSAAVALLLTALGEVQYREGAPWLAAATAAKARPLDPCLARLHLLNAELLQLNSAYASAAKELATAHALDPWDPGIRLRWLDTLPLSQRISALEAFLAADTATDPDEKRHLGFYLDHLKHRIAEPAPKSCRLVSDVSTTELEFSRIMQDATHIRAYALDVKLNDHSARLQIDTGASGLVISRSVAEHAGLSRFSNHQTSGVGSQGEVQSYSAYVDSIRVGALEFHDCMVNVIDKRDAFDSGDGLIGMDVFSRFLVTLDYPMRKLVLEPLPKRPSDESTAKPTLETANSLDENSSQSSEAGADTPAKPSQPSAPPASLLHDRYIAPEMKTWTPVYRVGHLLLTPATLNDSTTRLFVLDTGSFSTTVSPTVAREVTKVHSDDRANIHGLNGKVEKVYTTDHILFKFAGLAQDTHDVYAFESPSVSKNAGLEIAGFIGVRTLGQLTMTIDYRDALIKFTYDPNRGYRYQP